MGLTMLKKELLEKKGFIYQIQTNTTLQKQGKQLCEWCSQNFGFRQSINNPETLWYTVCDDLGIMTFVFRKKEHAVKFKLVWA